MPFKNTDPACAVETQSFIQEAPRSYHSLESPIPRSHVSVPKQPSTPNLYWMLAGLWSGVFLGALDGTVVATLLAPIGSFFNQSNQSAYIGSSYLLSMCCFTPLYGRLSDIIGRKGAMLTALSLFGSGTLLCGLAPSMEALLAARALAGMGGGGVMTVSSIAISDLIPLTDRGLYQGVTNLLYGIGAAVGGPFGGWVNDAFGWRAAFLLQAPIVVFALTLVAISLDIELPENVQNMPIRQKLYRIDFLGCLTLVGMIGCFILAVCLKTTEELRWVHPLVYGLLFAAVVCGTLFVMVETRWAPCPVMPLHLMTQRTPLAVSLCNFFGSASTFSMLYNVPLYLHTVKLQNSTHSGLHLLPHSIAIPIGSLLAGWVMRRTGKLYCLTLGSAFLMLLATLLVARWSKNSPPFNLYMDIVPQGLGMASLITSTLIAMIANVSKEDMAVATGITYLFRTTGQVLGVSLSGAVLQGVLIQRLQGRIRGPGADKLIDQIRHSTAIIPTLKSPALEAAVDSYADALNAVFICQAAVNVICLLSCVPIQESTRLRHKEQRERQDHTSIAD